MIERLWLRHFKSFGEVKLELLPLAVVVGGNASGKSNLVQAFRFLHDLIHFGVEEATARHGGGRTLANALVPERLRLVKRDAQDFSQIVYPASWKIVRAFLKQRIGLPDQSAKRLLEKREARFSPVVQVEL